MGEGKGQILPDPSRAFARRRLWSSGGSMIQSTSHGHFHKPEIPMNHNPIQRNIVLLIASVGLLSPVYTTQATPYASDVTNSAGVVSFRLNENADNVRIISSGG